MTRIGVGESQEREPFQAGARAAQAALRAAGVTSCDFVLMFATVGYNQEKLLRGVRSVTGHAPLSGCSGAGVVTRSGPHGEVAFTLSGSGTDMETVGVMVFSSDEMRFHNCLAEGLKGKSCPSGESTATTTRRWHCARSRSGSGERRSEGRAGRPPPTTCPRSRPSRCRCASSSRTSSATP